MMTSTLSHSSGSDEFVHFGKKIFISFSIDPAFIIWFIEPFGDENLVKLAFLPWPSAYRQLLGWDKLFARFGANYRSIWFRAYLVILIILQFILLVLVVIAIALVVDSKIKLLRLQQEHAFDALFIYILEWIIVALVFVEAILSKLW